MRRCGVRMITLDAELTLKSVPRHQWWDLG